MTRSLRLLAVVATALVLLSGGAFFAIRALNNHVDQSITQGDLFGSPTPTESGSATPSPTAPPAGSDIKGPLNLLIVGIDTRESKPGWVPHGDAVMILHVNADLSSAYLTSLPRDLVVNVPPFAPTNFGGRRTKLTHAMTFGSLVPGKKPDPAQGFALLAKAVSAYTGIKHFDAGGLLTFIGLRNVVDSLGGIDMYVDQEVVSIHMRPDGIHRAGCSSCTHGYTGPRMAYHVGNFHFNGWQALDYSRQRYISGGDYSRQRHQRQMIKAIVAKLFTTNLLTDPLALQRLLDALKGRFVFDGRGRKPSEFAYALHNLRPASITLVGLPGGGLYSGGTYLGERLYDVQASYFAALRADKLDAWAKTHANLISR